MPDPHLLSSIGELIAFGATAITSAVAGVVGGVRVAKAKHDTDAASSAHPQTIFFADAVHAEMQRWQHDVLPGIVSAAVATECQHLRNELTRLDAEHGATKDELSRLRNNVATSEAEGSRRWVEMSRAIASLDATLKGMT